MRPLETDRNGPSRSPSRRAMLTVLPAGVMGCLGCAKTMACPGSPQAAQAGHSWTEKADISWEDMFRFAYRKDLIPLLKSLAAQAGREKFVPTLRDASDDVVRRKTAGRAPVVRDMAGFAANLKNTPPLIQHAIEAEIVEQSPEAFEYRVKSCLWAKTFREEDAGDIGYAMICYPDYAVARGLNPKLRLIRTKTLMQGDPICSLRYVMES